jgi:hypothetical protein
VCATALAPQAPRQIRTKSIFDRSPKTPLSAWCKRSGKLVGVDLARIQREASRD